ncbi:MAG: bifunctional hydroxymethylpyrimidine kinase/phosphomethylpyrimidine kinase [Gemmatimonadetes bacterium]|nr:bifunctional hydroxymethylpyrimidine kinase/phosphomethylpyrimidine kinase [Gemmatimonadota bacterium]
MESHTPVALSIAGFDSSGCAGIPADLATFAAHGVHGAAAITTVTAQSASGVTALHPLPPDLVRAQIERALADLRPRAIKIGMLGPPDLVRALREALSATSAPVVLDPVGCATSGRSFLWADTLAEQIAPLLDRIALLTPNLPEARDLAGDDAVDSWCAGRPFAVLLKGGHAPGSRIEDRLYRPGETPLDFSHPRLELRSARGTGCTLSSAVAAGLALGRSLEDAVDGAIRYLQSILRTSIGRDPELGLDRSGRIVGQ